MNRTDRDLVLKDGRKLSYSTFGSENGFPIIYCHGSQSSRKEMHYDLSFATSNNLTIITIDRPGHGLSDFNPKGSILQFAKDVEALIDHLNIDRFSVVGMSAGAPFALGITHEMPSKIQQTAIISGFAPFNSESKQHLSKEVKMMLNLARKAPFLLRVLLKIQVKQLKKNSTKALKGFLKIMSDPDQEVMKNEQVMLVIKEMFTEAFRKGHEGVAHEISHILVKDWGFKLKNITSQVTFWQGEEDNNVPHKWAQLMANNVQDAKLNIIPNEGHLIIFNHADTIFSDLAK